MARYSLILKDDTYVGLMKQASALGLSFGKYANQILDKQLKLEVKENRCFVCGALPIIEVLGQSGQMIYLCKVHASLEAKLGHTYKVVKP
jgi:hypothetical protein